MPCLAVMPGSPIVAHAGEVRTPAERTATVRTVMKKRAIIQADVALSVGNTAVVIATHFVKDRYFQTSLHVLPHVQYFPAPCGKPRVQGVNGGSLKRAVSALAVIKQRSVMQRHIAHRVRHDGPHGHVQTLNPSIMQMAKRFPARVRVGAVVEKTPVMRPEQAVVIPDGTVMQRKAPLAPVFILRLDGKPYAVPLRKGRLILKVGLPGHGPQDGTRGLVFVHQPAEPGQNIRVQPLFRDFHQLHVKLCPAQAVIVGGCSVVGQGRVMAAHVVHRYDDRACKAIFSKNPHQPLNLAAQLVPGKSVDHAQAVAFVRVIACAQDAPAGPVGDYPFIVSRGRIPLAAKPQNVLPHVIHIQRQPLRQRRYRAGTEDGGPVQLVMEILPERACHGLFLRHPDRLQVQGFQHGQPPRRNLHILRRAFPADALHPGDGNKAGGQAVPHHVPADGKARDSRIVTVGKHGANPILRFSLHGVRVSGEQFQHRLDRHRHRLRRFHQKVVIDDDGAIQGCADLSQQACRGQSRRALDHHVHRAFPARMLIRHIHVHHTGNGKRGGFIGRAGHARLALPGQHIAPPQTRVAFRIRAFLNQPVRRIGHTRNAFHRSDKLAYLPHCGVGSLAVFLRRGGHGHGCRAFRQYGQLIRHITVDIALAVGLCPHDTPGGNAHVPGLIPTQKQHVAPRLRGRLSGFVHLCRVRVQPLPRGLKRNSLPMDDGKKVVELPQAPGEQLDDAPRDALVQIEACRQPALGRILVLHGLDAFKKSGADIAYIFGES
nr:MAG TPA: hypothetical protein [Caudoviricetes sp.]